MVQFLITVTIVSALVIVAAIFYTIHVVQKESDEVRRVIGVTNAAIDAVVEGVGTVGERVSAINAQECPECRRNDEEDDE